MVYFTWCVVWLSSISLIFLSSYFIRLHRVSAALKGNDSIHNNHNAAFLRCSNSVPQDVRMTQLLPQVCLQWGFKAKRTPQLSAATFTLVQPACMCIYDSVIPECPLCWTDFQSFHSRREHALWTNLISSGFYKSITRRYKCSKLLSISKSIAIEKPSMS